MELRRIETPGIAHYAYLIADGSEAAVVDPRRDVDEYLAAARSVGARIRYVLETHRHEDFVMGSASLAERAGAEVVHLDHEVFRHGDVRLSDGDTLRLGGLTLRVLHTPGHTPESACYAVSTGSDGSGAWCVFTGDSLFFGETGRTDLPDPERTAENAALLHDSLHAGLADLEDTALVLPAHGPGSVCGSGMASLPFSTLGAERRSNPVFTRSREAFAEQKASQRLPRPPYFRHMEEVNRDGGLPRGPRPGEAALLAPDAFAECSEGEIVVDAREPEAFAGGHVPGSYSVWMGGMPIFGGWVCRHDAPAYLVTERDDDVDRAALHLARIGIDDVRGALSFGAWRRSARPIQHSGVIAPRELARQLGEIQVLDVREQGEFESGHIPNARHLYVGYLDEGIAKLDLDRMQPVAVTCGVGHRAGLGASILLRRGFRDVRNLLGGMTAWRKLELPEER